MIPNRREFLRTSLATGSLVSWGLTVPTFLGRTAAAAPVAGKPGARDAPTLTEGWSGKARKGLPPTPTFHLAGSNESAPLALAGAPVRAPSITSLEDFQLKTAAASKSDKTQQRALIEGVAKGPAGKS